MNDYLSIADQEFVSPAYCTIGIDAASRHAQGKPIAFKVFIETPVVIHSSL
jgi:hypothetical protein